MLLLSISLFSLSLKVFALSGSLIMAPGKSECPEILFTTVSAEEVVENYPIFLKAVLCHAEQKVSGSSNALNLTVDYVEYLAEYFVSDGKFKVDYQEHEELQEHYLANTKWEFRNYISEDDPFQLNIKTIIPRYEPRTLRDFRMAFEALYPRTVALLQHEKTHQKITIGVVRALINFLEKTFFTVYRDNELFQNATTIIRTLNSEYDKKTQHGAKEGASFGNIL